MHRVGFLIAVAIACALFLSGGAGAEEITGAGATFPAPIYKKWIDDFLSKNPGISISYRAEGSEAGLQELQSGRVDFAAIDFPLPSNIARQFQLEAYPTVIGAVVLIYNLPQLRTDLRVTPEILAGIYLGQISRWNDFRIKAVNRSANLPAADINPFHRSDGSGTTYVWTDYLARANGQWRSSLGIGTKLPWHVGSGVKGSEGMAEAVARTPNSVGYVEFIYALQHGLNVAAVMNARGRFIRASIDSLTAAAKLKPSSSDAESIANAGEPGAYPICSFT